MSDRQSFTQAVYDYLTARPGVYVSAVVLESIGGRQAWRTRVSDARRMVKARRLGDIENRLRRLKRVDGGTWVLSEYAYIPAESVTVRVEENGQAAFL